MSDTIEAIARAIWLAPDQHDRGFICSMDDWSALADGSPLKGTFRNRARAAYLETLRRLMPEEGTQAIGVRLPNGDFTMVNADTIRAFLLQELRIAEAERD